MYFYVNINMFVLVYKIDVKNNIIYFYIGKYLRTFLTYVICPQARKKKRTYPKPPAEQLIGFQDQFPPLSAVPLMVASLEVRSPEKNQRLESMIGRNSLFSGAVCWLVLGSRMLRSSKIG